MLEKVVAQGESKAVPVEGVGVGGPFIQIRMSGEASERVVWCGYFGVVIFVFLKVVPHEVV